MLPLIKQLVVDCLFSKTDKNLSIFACPKFLQAQNLTKYSPKNLFTIFLHFWNVFSRLWEERDDNNEMPLSWNMWFSRFMCWRLQVPWRWRNCFDGHLQPLPGNFQLDVIMTSSDLTSSQHFSRAVLVQETNQFSTTENASQETNANKPNHQKSTKIMFQSASHHRKSL